MHKHTHTIAAQSCLFPVVGDMYSRHRPNLLRTGNTPPRCLSESQARRERWTARNSLSPLFRTLKPTLTRVVRDALPDGLLESKNINVQIPVTQVAAVAFATTSSFRAACREI